MAGVLQHLRSSTLDKRPNPASMVDGQVAINYASGAPGMFFKDSNGSLVKVGPVHVGSGAPNAVPASGGTAGNSIGEQWLDTSGGTYVFKIWDGSAWRSEAGEFVNVTGDTMTGDLVLNNANLVFEGSTANDFETTLTVVDPTADRTITLPNVTGTVVTTGDSGTVTSAMIANATIVNANVNASAAIAGTKISPNFGSQTVQTTGIFTAASGSASAPAIAFTADTNTGIYSPGADQVAISTNGTGRLFVDASGKILAGQSAVLSNATGPRLELTDDIVINTSATGTGTEAGLNFYHLVSTSTATRAGARIASISTGSFTAGNTTTNDSDLVFSTALNGALGEKLRITSDGKLGLGTSSPGKLLAAEGSTTPGISVKTTSASSYSTNEAINDANDYIQLFANGSTRAAFGALDTGETALLSSKSVSIMAANANQVIKFATGGSTERLRITSDAYVRLASASGGIQFNGDTAAANALDDYEEGTWTPAYQTSNGDISITSTTVSHAVYTKIGNRVFCTCRFFSNVASGGTGTVRVTGLPFTTASTQADVSCAVSFAARFSTAAPVTATVRSSSTELDLITVYTDATLGGGITYMPAANLRTGVASQNILSISFNYTV